MEKPIQPIQQRGNSLWLHQHPKHARKLLYKLNTAPMSNNALANVPPGFGDEGYAHEQPNPKRQLSDIITRTFSNYTSQYSNPNYVPFPTQPYHTKAPLPNDFGNYTLFKPKTTTLSSTLLPNFQTGLDDKITPAPNSSLSSNSLFNYLPLSITNKEPPQLTEKPKVDIGKKEAKTTLEILLMNNTLLENILDPKKGQSIQKDLSKCGPCAIDDVIDKVFTSHSSIVTFHFFLRIGMVIIS